MNNNLLFILLMVGSVFIATRLFDKPTALAPVTAAATVSATAPPVAANTRTQEKNGINITVKGMEQREDATVLTLVLTITNSIWRKMPSTMKQPSTESVRVHIPFSPTMPADITRKQK